MSALGKWLLAIGGSIATIVAARLVWKSLSGRKTQVGTVSKLIIYPIKSCKGIEFSEAVCTHHGLASGLLRDRQFMVAESKTGVFVSARTQPRLVLVICKYDSETSNLFINAPEMDELIINISELGTESKRTGTVWRSELDAVECCVAASSWFSQYLQLEVSLLFFHPSVSVRKVEPSVGNAHNRQSRPNEENAVTMFADGYPYLLCNDKSVDKVNTDVGSQLVTWENFRPNILLTSTERPFVEDNWRSLDIGGLKMFAEKPCGRCSLPNVNPSTGVVNPRAEPYNTLYKTRLLKEYNKRAPMFGMNLILDGDSGTIRTGDVAFSY